MNDRLSVIIRIPALVEDAVRAALAEALAARRMRLGEIDSRSFGNRALEHARAALDAVPEPFDALGRHELDVATVAAASRFFAAPVGRRILTIDPGRLGAPPPGGDLRARDERGCVHVVRLEVCTGDEARRDLGALLARGLPAARVHLLSLRDGRLRSYGPRARAVAPEVARVA